MNARLAIAALLLAATAFASAAERNVVAIGAGDVVDDDMMIGAEVFSVDKDAIAIGAGDKATGDCRAYASDAGDFCLPERGAIAPLRTSGVSRSGGADSDSTAVWNGSKLDTIVCDSDWDCDLKRLKLRLGAAAVAAGFTADWTDAEVARAMAAACESLWGKGTVCQHPTGAGVTAVSVKCGLNSDWECFQQLLLEEAHDHEKYMAAECESLWGKGTVCGVPTGAGAKVAGPSCLFGSDCDLNSDSTDVWNGSEPDTIVCDSDWDCDLQRLKLRLGVAALAAGFTADWTDAEVARAMAAAMKTRDKD